MRKKSILKKISVIFVMLVLMFSVFSVALVQAGTVNQGWNFLMTGYAVDDVSIDDEDVFVDTNLYSEAAGLTPDSVFYFVDTFFDRYQTPEEIANEKLGEMQLMIEDGAYDDAGVAAGHYSDAAGVLKEDIQTAESPDEFFQDEIIVYERDAFVDYLKMQLVDAVESGVIDESQASSTGVDDIQSQNIDLKVDLIETRQEYVTQYAEEQGISEIEADFVIQDKETEFGVGTYQSQGLSENLPAASESYLLTKRELEELWDNDELSGEDQMVLENLLSEIELHLEGAAGDYEAGFIGDAQSELADAEDLLMYTDELIGNWPIGDVSEVEERIEAEQSEREEEVNSDSDEYSQYLEQLKEKYPDRAEEIQKDAERMQKIKELAGAYQEQMGEIYQDLLDEGKTEIEATSLIEDRFHNLYMEVYGEPYTPPGFYEDEIHDEEELEIIPIGRIDSEQQQQRVNDLNGEINTELVTLWDQLIAEGKTEQEANLELGKFFNEKYLEVYGESYQPLGMGEFETGVVEYQDGEIVVDDSELSSDSRGGFIMDHEYVDPVSGNTYVFTEEGYSYTDFLGLEHEVKYDEEFKPEEELNGFEDGTEVYDYVIYEDDEMVIYEYTATGYTIVDESGEEVNTEVYPEGNYETISKDSEIEIDTFGFEVDPSDGDPVIYEYSPEFKNYVSVNGQVYVPPQGASYHYKEVDYKDGIYEYSSEGEKWAYDPSAGVWTSVSGEVYVPYVTSVAPAGYESYGRYETESGKTWTYDDMTGEWNSDAGDQWAYYKDEGTWRNTETGIAYNPSLTYQTYSYNTADSSGKGSYQSYTTYEGVTWSFDEETNAWSSSNGDAYYVPDYSSYNMGYMSAEETGGSTEGYSYSYYGYHTEESTSSGTGSEMESTTWSYDSDTGGWKSSTGETYYTPISTNYYAPSYTSESSGSSSGATGDSSHSWTYDSSTGSWMSSSGESYTPSYYTYSSGSYSSGDSMSSSGSSSSSGTSSGSSYSPSYAPSYSGGSYSTGGSYSSGDSSYSAGSYSGGSYSSGDSSSSGGSYSGGYTGGDSGSSSGGGSSGGSSGGGDSGGSSGGSSGGGDSGGSSGGGDSGGGGMTGFVSLSLYRSFRN